MQFYFFFVIKNKNNVSKNLAGKFDFNIYFHNIEMSKLIQKTLQRHTYLNKEQQKRKEELKDKKYNL